MVVLRSSSNNMKPQHIQNDIGILEIRALKPTLPGRFGSFTRSQRKHVGSMFDEDRNTKYIDNRLVALYAMQVVSIDMDEQGAFVQSAADGIRLFNEAGECKAESEAYDTKSAIVIYHGISVFAIWGVLVPLGIIVARYFSFIRACPSLAPL
jgi:hypothetical protein